MVLVDIKKEDGTEDTLYFHELLIKNLDDVKNAVIKKGWDYLAIVSGIPGVGKSTLAQQICKYLDPTFNAKERICFTGTGEKGFIERTTNGKLGQAFMLDESFESLNSRVSGSSEFLKIINHLQLIRQKGLFMILCLPNFFDLSKGIAIFRASHLFVVYSDSFQRGFFAAFGRDEKRRLYVKGNKFVDYNAEKPNFRGDFRQKWVVDKDLYDNLKVQHLIDQSKAKDKGDKRLQQRNELIVWLKEDFKAPVKEIAAKIGVSTDDIYLILKNKRESLGS